jgi:hypothetical protein
MDDVEGGAVPEASPLLSPPRLAPPASKPSKKLAEPLPPPPRPLQCSLCRQLLSRCSIHIVVFVVAFGAVLALLLAKDLLAYWFARSLAAGVSIVFSNAYPSMTADYPWPIVEPSVATTLTAKGVGDSVDCAWLIEWVEDGRAKSTKRSGCDTVAHVFLGAPRTYTVTLQLSRFSGAYYSETLVATVMCKYVRREIRTLTTADREKYFSALEKVHRLSAADGLELYGSAFKNYEYFTAKHVDATEVQSYTATKWDVGVGGG